MSETKIAQDRQEGSLRTLLVAFGLAAGFLFWGLFLFYTVGDKGPPNWDYGRVPDVPGLSVYSTDSGRPLSGVPPFYLHEKAGLSPQHVKDKPIILQNTGLSTSAPLPPSPEPEKKEPPP